jgi:hypothetical protein
MPRQSDQPAVSDTSFEQGQPAVEIMITKNAGHNWRQVDAPIEPSTDELIQRTVDFLSQHMGATP